MITSGIGRIVGDCYFEIIISLIIIIEILFVNRMVK